MKQAIVGRDGRIRRDAGMTMVEALVTMTLVLVVSAIAVTGLRSDDFESRNARQRMTNELRKARASAISRGAHYRVSFTGQAYSVSRMEDDDGDGTWDAETSIVEMDLPHGMSTGASGNGASQSLANVEFDTRGMLVSIDGEEIAESMYLTVTDEDGAVRTCTIWPSGQIEWQNGDVTPTQPTGA